MRQEITTTRIKNKSLAPGTGAWPSWRTANQPLAKISIIFELYTSEMVAQKLLLVKHNMVLKEK